MLAIWGLGQLPLLGRDFRIACSLLAVLGLGGVHWTQFSEWHLLWYTPASIALAYLFAVRHLLDLNRRLDEIEHEPWQDLADLQSRVEQAVEEYNENVDEDRRLK